MTSDQLTASILHAIERYSSHKSQPPKQSNHIRLHGLSICIETPKGHRRRPDWPEMPADYGYIKRTEGADGDAVDVFIGPHQNSEMVYVIDQCCKDGTFDEHKVMLGYTNYKKAVDAYKNAYSKGWKVGKVTSMTIEQFKTWLKQGDKGSQIQHQVSRYAFDMFDDSGKPRLRPTLGGTGSYAPVPQTWAMNTGSPHVMSHQSQMPQDGAKQPWHMSINEFAEHHAKNPGMINGGLSPEDGLQAHEFIKKNFGPETYRVFKFTDRARKQHLYNIAHAMRTGQSVHPDAIADYPRDIIPQSNPGGNVLADQMLQGLPHHFENHNQHHTDRNWRPPQNRQGGSSEVTPYSASSTIPLIANGQTRLTHFFANPNLKKKFLSGEPFQYHKQGLIDLTTDSFSNNDDVHSLLQTGKVGAFDRGSFGSHVLIMDVPHADHRLHNNLQFASGEVHNGHIAGVYDRKSGQFYRNPAYGTAPQYKPELQQQVSQHRPSGGQQPQTHSTPVPHPSEHQPVRPDDIWSAPRSSIVERYANKSESGIVTNLSDDQHAKIGEAFQENSANRGGYFVPKHETLTAHGVTPTQMLTGDDQNMILFHAGVLGHGDVGKHLYGDNFDWNEYDKAQPELSASKFIFKLAGALNKHGTAKKKAEGEQRTQGANVVALKHPDGRRLILHPAVRKDKTSDWQLSYTTRDGQPAGHNNPKTFQDGLHEALGVHSSWAGNHHGFEIEWTDRDGTKAPYQLRADIDRYAEQHFDTPEFKQWFGDSKVKHPETGHPLKVYHGTRKGGFDSFSPNAGGRGTLHFSEQPKVASDYSFNHDDPGSAVYPVFLSMQNPATPESKRIAAKAIKDSGREFSEDLYKEELQKLGHDGWSVADEHVVFHPHQVKSATGNRGTYDPNDARMNYSTTADRYAGFQQPGLFDDMPSGGRFDEKKHPRWKGGDQAHRGGQFSPKQSGEPKAHQPNLFETHGHQDQGWLFGDEGAHGGMVLTPHDPEPVQQPAPASQPVAPREKPKTIQEADERIKAGGMRLGLFEEMGQQDANEARQAKIQQWRQSFTGNSRENIAAGDIAKSDWEKAAQNGVDPKRLAEMIDHAVLSGIHERSIGEHGKRQILGSPQSQGIIQPPKEIPNEQAKPGQQLGLFGDAPVQKVRPPKLDIGNDSKAKQRNLFDTGGNANQMDLFGDGVIPDDLVHKPQDPGMGAPQRPKGLAGFMRGESQPLPRPQEAKPMEDLPGNEPMGQPEEPKAAINPMARPEDIDHADHHLSLAHMPEKSEPGGDVDRFTKEINDPRTRNYLLSAAKQMTRDPHEAEDIVQDTMTKAFLSKHKYDPSQPFLGWIRTILERTKINNYRDKKALKRGGGKAIGSLDAPLDNDNGGSLHDQIGGDQRKKGSDIHPDEREAFNAALPSLPPNQRKIVEMHLEGHLKKEIADHLKVSGAAVGQALERALIALKKKISKNYVLDALIERYCRERDAEYYSMCFRVYRYSVFGEIDRYDNTEEAQPQAQPSKPQGGMFSGRMHNGTEIADRPASISRDHSLHLNQVANNPATHGVAKKLASSGLALRSMWSDAKAKHEASKSSGTPSSSPYDHIDWEATKGHLDDVNQLHKDSLAEGHNVANIANYNGIIPKWLHPKLASGRKFIDPSMLGAKWTKDTPQAPQAPKAPEAPGDSEHGFQTGWNSKWQPGNEHRGYGTQEEAKQAAMNHSQKKPEKQFAIAQHPKGLWYVAHREIGGAATPQQQQSKPQDSPLNQKMQQGRKPQAETENDPPVPEGMTRLYHGSATHGRYDGPAWFSTNRQYARDYRGKEAELQYVHMPTAWVNQHLDPDGYGQTVDKGHTLNIELHSDITGLRKPLLPKAAPSASPRPLQSSSQPNQTKSLPPSAPASQPAAGLIDRGSDPHPLEQGFRKKVPDEMKQKYDDLERRASKASGAEWRQIESQQAEFHKRAETNQFDLSKPYDPSAKIHSLEVMHGPLPDHIKEEHDRLQEEYPMGTDRRSTERRKFVLAAMDALHKRLERKDFSSGNPQLQPSQPSEKPKTPSLLDRPQAKEPVQSVGAQPKFQGDARPFNAGMNRGTIGFENELHRDLYDLGARIRNNISANNHFNPLLVKGTDSLEQRIASHPEIERMLKSGAINANELRNLAANTHEHAKAQMKGLKEGEHRWVKMAALGGSTNRRSQFENKTVPSSQDALDEGDLKKAFEPAEEDPPKIDPRNNPDHSDYDPLASEEGGWKKPLLIDMKPPSGYTPRKFKNVTDAIRSEHIPDELQGEISDKDIHAIGHMAAAMHDLENEPNRRKLSMLADLVGENSEDRRRQARMTAQDAHKREREKIELMDGLSPSEKAKRLEKAREAYRENEEKLLDEASKASQSAINIKLTSMRRMARADHDVVSAAKNSKMFAGFDAKAESLKQNHPDVFAGMPQSQTAEQRLWELLMEPHPEITPLRNHEAILRAAVDEFVQHHEAKKALRGLEKEGTQPGASGDTTPFSGVNHAQIYRYTMGAYARYSLTESLLKFCSRAS